MKTNEKNTQQGVVPALRFPEFQNSASWQIDTVENLVSTITPPCKLNTLEYQKSGVYPIVDQSQDLYCGWTNNQSAVIFQQFPLIIFGDHTCIIKLITQPFAQGADGVKILKSNKLIDPCFLYQCLEYKPIIQESYKRHFASLRNKIIAYPLKETGEQQKIAECLASIDALIKAAENKIDELENHKKGLMQQLFPAEGKTVPALRFPEFQNAGEWKSVSLDTIININKGEQVNKMTLTPVGSYPVINGGMQPSGYMEKFNTSAHTITISEGGNSCGFVNIINTNFWCGGHCYAITEKKDIEKVFLYQLLKNEEPSIMKLRVGSGLPNIQLETLKKHLTCIPQTQEEQQKIADCLSSLDDLITAQTNRLEALRNHKKGLMQQLFPNVNNREE